MLKAEDKCVSTFGCFPPWSTSLIKSSRPVWYWNPRITKYNNKQVSNKTLHKRQEESRVVDLTTTKEEAITCHITAKTALNK